MSHNLLNNESDEEQLLMGDPLLSESSIFEEESLNDDFPLPNCHNCNLNVQHEPREPLHRAGLVPQEDHDSSVPDYIYNALQKEFDMMWKKGPESDLETPMELDSDQSLPSYTLMVENSFLEGQSDTFNTMSSFEYDDLSNFMMVDGSDSCFMVSNTEEDINELSSVFNESDHSHVVPNMNLEMESMAPLLDESDSSFLNEAMFVESNDESSEEKQSEDDVSSCNTVVLWRPYLSDNPSPIRAIQNRGLRTPEYNERFATLEEEHYYRRYHEPNIESTPNAHNDRSFTTRELLFNLRMREMADNFWMNFENDLNKFLSK